MKNKGVYVLTNEQQSNIDFVIVKNCFRQDLKKHYITNFNDLHLLVLVYMQRFRAMNTNTMQFTLGWLYDDLSITNDKAKQDIIKALFDLFEMDLIELNDLDIDKVNRNTRIVASLSDYENNFTLIDNYAIDTIFELDLDIRQKKTMLFLYCNIASRIDDKGYCYPSYYILSKDLDTTSDNRIAVALELLKEHSLIDYDNAGEVVIDGQVTQANNIYVLCNNENYKETLEQGISNRKKQLEQGKAQIYKGLTSNKQRGLKQKFNHLHKKNDNKTISDDELKALEQVENDYFELIKLDIDKLKTINFITLKAKNKQLQVITKRLEKLTEHKDNLTEQELDQGRELYKIYKQLGGE